MQVLVVDDHPVVIAGCRAILASDSAISVIGASDAKTAVALYESERPDVVVVDLNLRGSISGFDLIETILGNDPTARIIVLTMAYDPVHAMRVIESGAKAYVGKSEDPERFLTAVRTVAAGQRFVGADMAQKLAFFDRGGRAERKLTAREREILSLLHKGKNMMEIADAIKMSYKTVANACAALKRNSARVPSPTSRGLRSKTNSPDSKSVESKQSRARLFPDSAAVNIYCIAISSHPHSYLSLREKLPTTLGNPSIARYLSS